MINAEFRYDGDNTIIQCNSNDKMKDIYAKFATKRNVDLNNVYFMYDGGAKNTFNDNLNLSQIMSKKINKENNKIVILVNKNSNSETENNIYAKSKDVICPECKNIISINIKNYKVNLYDCKNNHKKSNIPLNQFDETQNINLSKIICEKCRIKNKSNIFKNELYICLNCKMNLCPICKTKHNNNHKYINYDQVNYICPNHNDYFTTHCNDCNTDICMECEEDHSEHDTIYLGKILPNKAKLTNAIDNLKELIDQFNEECDEMIDVINKVKKNFELYYKIKKYMVDNLDLKKKNYKSFLNYKEIYNNDEIINDINEMHKKTSIDNKFTHLLNIFNKINNLETINLEKTVDLSKENEELKRRVNYYKELYEKEKNKNDLQLKIKTKYALIDKIIKMGIDQKTKVCKYNMSNKCLLAELVLSDFEALCTDKVAEVMLEVDRKDFAPSNFYLNRPQYIGYNVTISAPHMHAFALEHLSPYCIKGAKILDVGSGSGYLTVALSKLTNDTGLVVGVEHIPELYQFGINNVKKNHGKLLDDKKIIFVNEDGRKGCPKYGPYKAIHVGAASEQLPQELINQLDFNGRMFIPIGPKGETQNIYLIDKDGNGKVTYKSILAVCYGMLTDKEKQLNQ